MLSRSSEVCRMLVSRPNAVKNILASLEKFSTFVTSAKFYVKKNRSPDDLTDAQQTQRRLRR
jgi:hypothetical protein